MEPPGGHNSHISRLLELLQKYGDAVLALSIIIGGILYVGSVSSRTQENTDRLDRQKDSMIRTESEFRANFATQQIQLNDLVKSTTRIEQYLKDQHDKHF